MKRKPGTITTCTALFEGPFTIVAEFGVASARLSSLIELPSTLSKLMDEASLLFMILDMIFPAEMIWDFKGCHYDTPDKGFRN
jgi:hypothetical protein